MNNATTQQRNVLIDYVKIVLVFFVICIHFPLGSWIEPILFICVPLFFMFSAYFIAISKKDQLQKARENIISTLKYLLFGLLFVVVFLFVYTLCKGDSLSVLYKDIFPAGLYHVLLFRLLLFQFGNHIWFLFALFVFAILHYILVKTKSTFLYLPIAIGVFVLAIFFNIHRVYHIVYFAIGYVLGKRQFNINIYQKLLLLCVSIGILFAVDFIGRDLLIIIPIFLVCITTKLNVSKSYLRPNPRLVFNIYIIHWAMGVVWKEIGLKGFLLPIVVMISCVVIVTLVSYGIRYFRFLGSCVCARGG